MDRKHESLSDEDLDAQLTAYNDNMEGVMTGKQTGKTVNGEFRANVNDVIAQAFQRIATISERDDTVDAAVKARIHAIFGTVVIFVFPGTEIV